MSDSQTENATPPTLLDQVVKVVSILLAVVFAGAAIFKVVSWSSTVEEFERFGYEPWFIWVTVLVELIAAGLIISSHPMIKSWGTTLITITMVAAMLSHLKADEPVGMISPLIVMMMGIFVAWYGPMKPSEEELARERERNGPAPETAGEIAKYYGAIVVTFVAGYFGIVYLIGQGPFIHDGRQRFVVAFVFFAIAVYCYSINSPKPLEEAEEASSKSSRKP